MAHDKIKQEVIFVNKKLVLVTGMSGAGKSTAMSVMEDMGYRCIDQLPIQLLSDFLQLIQTK